MWASPEGLVFFRSEDVDGHLLRLCLPQVQPVLECGCRDQSWREGLSHRRAESLEHSRFWWPGLEGSHW